MPTLERDRRSTEPGSLPVRGATATDLLQIAAIFAQLRFRSGSQPFTSASRLTDYLRADGLFAICDGPEQVVGAMAVKSHNSTLYIEAIAIAPGYHHRGFGRELIETAVEIARRTGKRAVVVGSNTSFQESWRFYERLGFKLTKWPDPLGDVEFELQI